MKWKDILKLTGIPVIAASLCCLSPLIFVLLGLGTATLASSLSDTLYGEYKWVFRGVGLLLLAFALIVYFRRGKNICTIDQVKKRKKEILNITLISLTVAIVGYVFFLYVVVHYAGVAVGIWESYF